MKKSSITKFLILGFICLSVFSCSESEDITMSQSTTSPQSTTRLQKVTSAWSRMFTDNFDNTTSFNNWTRTNRLDYNSKWCQYDPTVPSIGLYDNRKVLVITATKSGTSLWKSGHVKSKFSFKPAKNEEFHLTSAIKVIAMNGTNFTGFSSTYGVWPAFWTVQEINWPTGGEIDILEAFSYGNIANYTAKANYTTNIMYGPTVGKPILASAVTRTYTGNEGWHVYDLYWKNLNGLVTVTIMVDGVTISTYTNSSDINLKLENFGAHNIILNLCVGDNYAFNNNLINVFTKTMMWVDFVIVEKRKL